MELVGVIYRNTYGIVKRKVKNSTKKNEKKIFRLAQNMSYRVQSTNLPEKFEP